MEYGEISALARTYTPTVPKIIHNAVALGALNTGCGRKNVKLFFARKR